MTEQRPAMLWTVNRTCALILGIIFVILGIIGFITPTENGTGVRAIFGIFDTDTVHSIFYLITGLLGVAAAFTSQSRTFNQVFGVVYTLLGLVALIPALYFPAGTYGTDNGLFLGITHMNAGDHVLHLVTGIIALAVGFFFAGSAQHATPEAPRQGTLE